VRRYHEYRRAIAEPDGMDSGKSDIRFCAFGSRGWLRGFALGAGHLPSRTFVDAAAAHPTWHLYQTERAQAFGNEATMFERFSEKARRVIFFARYEASQFGSPAIDSEHLLLGILRESQDLPSAISPSASADTIKERIRRQAPIRDKIPTSIDLPFSESAKVALNAAAEEADRLDSRIISTQHLLLGLLREETCLAQRILAELGVALEAARKTAASWIEEGSESLAFTLPGGVTGRVVPNDEFQKVIINAIEEAGLLRSPSARPEHLLLGLLRNEGSLAAQILREAGLDLDGVRRRLGAS
jgi:ATP-dependent Clp protease ATP-binding subunit ClpA